MAWAQVGSMTTAYTASGLTVAPAKPTGLAVNDVMFGLTCRGSTGVSVTPPSGWAEIARNVATYAWMLWWKLADATDVAASTFTWTWLANQKTIAAICAFRGGFNTADVIEDYSNTAYTTSNTTLRAASVGAVTGPVLIIGAAYNTSSTTFTEPNSFTENGDAGHTDPDFWIHMASKVWASTAETNTIDATMSATLTAKHAFAVALNPSAAVAVKNMMLMGVG